MPNRLITYAHRAELIERFNHRIDNPASYVDVPSYTSVSMAAEGRFDVEIPQASIIGHGALVLAMMQDSAIEAIPFALDPKKYARIPDDDWGSVYIDTSLMKSQMNYVRRSQFLTAPWIFILSLMEEYWHSVGDAVMS